MHFRYSRVGTGVACVAGRLAGRDASPAFALQWFAIFADTFSEGEVLEVLEVLEVPRPLRHAVLLLYIGPDILAGRTARSPHCCRRSLSPAPPPPAKRKR